MTQATARELAQPERPAFEPSRPVRPVEDTRTRVRPRLRYAVVAVSGIFAILLAQLGLSMLAAEGAYRIDELQYANKELARDVQVLTEQERRLSSTQHLVANAAELGMVNNSRRVFLRLSDGAVLGTPRPATSAGAVADSGTTLVANSLVAGLPVVGASPEPNPSSQPPAERASAPQTANSQIPSPVVH